MSSATISAPALETSSRNSARDSSASRPVENEGEGRWMSGSPASAGSVLRRTAARAPARPARLVRERTVRSTPTRMARSELALERPEIVVRSMPEARLLPESTSNRNRSSRGVAGPCGRCAYRRWTETCMHSGGAMLTVEHAPIADHGGNGVLEDQLLLAVVFKKHGILVEGPNFSGELDAADQVNGDGGLVLANRIQEGVLNILCRLILHLPISYFPQRLDA